MTGKIFRSCFLVGLAVMILCTGLFVAVMASQYEEEVYQQLQEELAYVKHGMEESGQAYLTGLRTTQRLTWVDTDGTVLYDSVADPATMENHGDRAEIRQALEEGSGQGKHLSNTLLQKNLYYAARLSDGTVLRISCVETTVGALILGVLQPVLWILVLALILSGILASRLSRQITKPINSLDLENPRLDETYEELFPLVSRLREQNRTIGRQMDALGRRQREFAALAENSRRRLSRSSRSVTSTMRITAPVTCPLAVTGLARISKMWDSPRIRVSAWRPARALPAASQISRRQVPCRMLSGCCFSPSK